MKKYLYAASLFLFNSEVISWIAVTLICFMGVAALIKEMNEGGFFD